ncbi:MAG: hypothetical protein EWM47_11240 [Anaerolineaceae bacterium]|nr:MAG: hypothetical protein EWM47_11240 [Anaerolineaceae bacterium]
MGRLSSIYRRVFISVIVIFLPVLLIPGFDIQTSIFISFGFGISLSLWSLSIMLEKSFTFSISNKASNQSKSAFVPE